MCGVLPTVCSCKEILEKGFHISGTQSSQLIFWRLYNNSQVGRAVIEKVAGLQVKCQLLIQKAFFFNFLSSNMWSVGRSVLSDNDFKKNKIFVDRRHANGIRLDTLTLVRRACLL